MFPSSRYAPRSPWAVAVSFLVILVVTSLVPSESPAIQRHTCRDDTPALTARPLHQRPHPVVC